MINLLSNDLDYILEHTRDLWTELRGERIFLTGGTGFFGCWLLESFLWANDRLSLNSQVTVLSRSPNAFRTKAPHLAGHAAVSVMQGDIRTFAFPAGTFACVIHAANESSARLNAEAPLQMLETIVEGTRRTLEFAKAAGTRNFLLTSSGAIYGKQPEQITHIPEEYSGAPDPLAPQSAYGEGKRLAEHLCALYADTRLQPKIARGFAFVGPYLPLDIHFAIGNFIRDALNGGPILVKGDGTPRRSYLYAADLAVWLWTILLRGHPGRPYNVGSEKSLSIAETARSVARCISPEIPVEIRGVANPNSPVEQYIPSTQRARAELNLHDGLDLTEKILRTLNWHRSHAFHSQVSRG